LLPLKLCRRNDAMSEAYPGGRAGVANRCDSGQAIALRATEWLGLAAAPTFAIMALHTAIHDGGMADMLCSAAHGVSPLCGMTAMYLLMSAFHSAAWLKLISGRRSAANRSSQMGRSWIAEDH
jgi:hypothetical protein